MKKNFILTISFFIICCILCSIFIGLANNQFLDNAQLMGDEIAKNLVNIEEQTYISKYKEILNLVSEEINSSNNINEEKINNICEKYDNLILTNQIDIYIVKSGEIYLYNNKLSKLNLNYNDEVWYKNAIEKDKEMIATNLYENNNGDKTVTFAIKSNNQNDVVAVNLYVEKITEWPSLEFLPEGSRYHICDSEGNRIHSEGEDLNLGDIKTRENVENLLKDVEEGKYKKATSYFVDENDNKRGVYYAKTDTNWTFIITIPYDYLLKGFNIISIAYYATIFVFIILIVYLIIAERKSNKNNSLYNRITKALGDSYYALYLVDLKTATYSMLKASDHVRATIPRSGTYDVFIDCLETVIEKEAYSEFKEAFSIENMKSLVNKNVHNFGGDFKRIFNSEIRWISVHMLYNESKSEKEKTEVVLAFQDISYEKERELEKMQIIKDSIEATENAVTSKNKFFANMSHDMRTPLNAIINLSSLSKEQIDNKEKLTDYLNKINISSKQLLDLINDILEVSRMEDGINNINKTKFDIESELKDTLSVFEEEAKAQSKNFKVVYNIKNKFVIGDWGKLRQVVNNIVSNALKYTMPNGNIVVEINEIEGKFVSKYEIIVGDDGIGMTKEFLDKIYTPFARETRFHSDKIAGTGLGMVVVNNNVQKLNGQIEIKSETGKGTTFKVTIPLEITDEIKDKVKDKVKEEPKGIDLRGKKILIAEDNELNMEISTEVLEMQGVIVTKAMNGQEAVDIFTKSKEGEFDAILMDMQMPILDGCEATRKIRKLPRRDAKIIPILAVTANTFAEDIINTQKAGMNDHIAKPIDFTELQKVLAKYLNK